MRDLLEFDYESEAEVSNIVATANFGAPILLEALTLELGMERTEYNPENSSPH